MRIGDTLEGKIVGIKPYGAFVECENGLTGLIHISEIKTGYVDNIYRILSLGQTVTVQVIDYDEYTKKVSFSMRTLESVKKVVHSNHRFSNSRYKIGFKPLAKALPTWLADSMIFLKKDKKD
ncbi:S1 RNA-binding domain-containing protein [Streptococcus cuniculipharyngis]|uniref:S1 RNA-binding domain-containing protein n=1 Tax=Streptococcus cuniculipharyngis TaxID=1562651 RepID=A0A5C5SC04_9STRE|nr:S1 RNA-binding domain-containing protein [Streptococcus cuniculipharyngis]TWS98094.1 S1 RNA-binding domain-containing protein [Streptococcus cuniculipharyngis]